MAAAWNRVESLKALIDSGADRELKNSYNELARDVAERYGNHSCMNYLDSAGLPFLPLLVSMACTFYLNCPYDCCSLV